jgi:hypothetical protein
MTNARKKRHRAVEITDPDFGGAGVEVEGAFVVDFGSRVRRREEINANRRSGGKRRCRISDQPAFLSVCKQDDIGNSHLPVASKDRLLDCGEFAGVKLVEEIGNSASSLAVVEARGWGHDELAARVDLDTFEAIGEGGINTNFQPAFGGGSVG